jgi:hypothetical protein
MDPVILHEFYNQWKSYPPKSKGRGEVVKTMCLTGMYPSTAHKKLAQIDNGASVYDASRGLKRGKARRTEAEINRDKHDAKQIAGLIASFNRKGHSMSFDRAAELAFSEGLVSRLYDRHWVARKFKEFKLEPKRMNAEKRAVSFRAEYPLHCVMVDASPADQVFFSLEKKRFELHPELFRLDTHFEDHLEKAKLTKVYVYVAVDIFSKAYYVRYYAPAPIGGQSRYGGENATDWFDFLTRLFYEKDPVYLHGKRYDVPLFGVPTMIYSDKGSGLTSLSEFMSRLTIRFETHQKGSPRAKGAVERRIGAWKQQMERILIREFISDLEELRTWSDQWMYADNYKKGFYQEFIDGTKLHPIRTCSPKNVHDATVGVKTRIVTKYHTVNFLGGEYLVNDPDILPGQKVKVFESLTGSIMIQTPANKLVPVNLAKKGPVTVIPGSYEFNDGHKNLISDTEQDRIEAIIMGNQAKRALTLDSMRPVIPEDNLRLMPIRKTVAIETHSSFPPEQFTTTESARLWLINETGVTDDMLSDDLRKRIYSGFDALVENDLPIPAEIVLRFRNIIQEHLNNLQKQIINGE